MPIHAVVAPATKNFIFDTGERDIMGLRLERPTILARYS